MSKYKEIKGFKVQTLSTDPVASGLAGATWSSIASLNTARDSVSSGGTTTAGIVAGGYDGEGYPSGYTGLTETWNGSSWTETTDMNSGRTSHGFGTQTSLIAGAGNRGVSSPPSLPGYQNLVESWNGSAWTEVAEYNNNISARGTAGQSGTAGIVFGGITPAGGNGFYTESWNGSSWTELNDLNASRYNLATNAGTQTSALGVGGQFPSPPIDGTLVESWNGSSWTEIAELNTARNQMGGSGTGNTSLLVFGGNPGVKANTESWDGSSWTERNDLATARKNNGGLGTSATSAIYAGGLDATTYTAVSEEFSVAGATESLQNLGQVYYNSTSNAFKVTEQPVPGGSWSSGGAMNTARVFDATAQTGGNSAGQIAGGTFPTGPSAVNTEQYNGTAWTEVNNLNAGRFDIFGTGTQTSAIAASGYTTTWVGNTETWNGSTWTEVADVNQARKEGGSSGISATSALIFGGEGSPSSTPYALTESWNGSSWTEVGDLNGAIYGTSGGGTQTDAIRAGGVTTGSGNPSATVETWNGTSWTETTDINTSRGYNAASAANSTAALIAGGTTNTGPSLSVLTENWNGSSWTEVGDLATARYKVNGSGTSTEALAIGGGPNTSGGTATEEWTVPEVNKTITVS